MVEEKLDQLMTELRDMKQDVASAQLAQERTALELSRRLGTTSYQSRKKENEMQYNFNMGVEDSIASARRELTRMTPTGLKERESVKRASDYLDEGASVLKTCQKHIKAADRST